jgi:hypothetical protein
VGFLHVGFLHVGFLHVGFLHVGCPTRRLAFAYARVTCRLAEFRARRALRKTSGISAPRRGEADGPRRETIHHWFPRWTRPRRTQCGVGADDGCVTGGYRPRCDPLIGPQSPPSQGARLRVSGLSPLSLLTFFAAAKKVSACPAQGRTLINQKQTKERPTPQAQGNPSINKKPPPATSGKTPLQTKIYGTIQNPNPHGVQKERCNPLPHSTPCVLS